MPATTFNVLEHVYRTLKVICLFWCNKGLKSVCLQFQEYLAWTVLFIFVTAKMKAELKEEVKPKVVKAEEKVGGIRSKVML
jgi:hypothetical protein